MVNRTPPPNSLAADILGVKYPDLSLKGNKSIFTSIKDIQDALSDFNSCNSTLESSSDDSSYSDVADSFPLKNAQVKRKKKQKNLPGREEFLKKPNTQVSPK